MGQDKRVRQALELSIDRDAINQVVFEGQFSARQPVLLAGRTSTTTPRIPIPPRDVAKAKALLKAGGREDPGRDRGHHVQQPALAGGDAGHPVDGGRRPASTSSCESTEFATMLNEGTKGDFQANQYGWSGRPDPDGNIHAFVTCKGDLNDWKYCNPEVDKLLDEARTISDRRSARSVTRRAEDPPRGPADHSSLPRELDLGREEEDHRLPAPSRWHDPPREREVRVVTLPGRPHPPRSARRASKRARPAGPCPLSEGAPDALLHRTANPDRDPDHHPGLDLRVHPAEAAAGRSHPRARGRGARPRRHRAAAREIPARTIRCPSSISPGLARPCRAISASRCAPTRRCWS